jgi:hypothetical protein
MQLGDASLRSSGHIREAECASRAWVHRFHHIAAVWLYGPSHAPPHVGDEVEAGHGATISKCERLGVQVVNVGLGDVLVDAIKLQSVRYAVRRAVTPAATLWGPGVAVPVSVISS